MRRTVIAFCLSVIAHPLLIALFLGISWLTRTERPPRVEPRPVTMRTMSYREWNKNRGQPEPMPTGQVVDVAPGNLVRPAQSKYLAETDNSIRQQTRAKQQANQWRVAAAKPAPPPEAVTLASQLQRFSDALGPKPRVGPLLSSALAQDDRPVEETDATGGDAPNDDLNDVEKGEATSLNTREWKYAGFFNHVKKAVAAKWDPNGRLKQKEPSRQLLADRYTMLAVALRPDGSIADLYVAKPCGIDVLDQEAMAAFERAAPFLDVPAGLIQNGFVRFQFGFTLTHSENGFMPAMR